MPIGVPITTASAVSTRLPMIGLSKPPSAPGGGVISVKTLSDRPLKPSYSSTPRISTSQPRPKSVAPSDRPIAMPLRLRRALYRVLCTRLSLCACSFPTPGAHPGSGSRTCFWGSCASADPPLEPQQHVARASEHDEGDDEQDEAERDQRGCVEIAHRLGEFVRDGRRDRGAGRENRSRYPVRIADHEGDRHGLAER